MRRMASSAEAERQCPCHEKEAPLAEVSMLRQFEVAILMNTEPPLACGSIALRSPVLPAK